MVEKSIFASNWILVPILLGKIWELQVFPERLIMYDLFINIVSHKIAFNLTVSLRPTISHLSSFSAKWL